MSDQAGTPPAVVIRVEFERVSPVVYCDAREADRLRMRAWFELHPELEDLVLYALELTELAA